MNKNKKSIKEMTSDEMLRQQLELLAKRSLKTKSVKNLVKLTSAMNEIANTREIY
jgi:hypothetical protein